MLGGPVRTQEVLSIDISASHIAQGVRASEDRCPIAIAVRELLPEARQVAVTDGALRIDGALWRLGFKAGYFLNMFDMGLPVSPRRVTASKLAPHDAARMEGRTA